MNNKYSKEAQTQQIEEMKLQSENNEKQMQENNISVSNELENEEKATSKREVISNEQEIRLSQKANQKIQALKNRVFDKDDFGLEQWIDIKELKIDEDTQRGIMASQVEKIINEFNPSSFGRITVSKRKDGYYVVNGQHRIMACRKIGIKQAPCIVIRNENDTETGMKKQDAIQFLEINQNSQAVRAIDKYRIGVSAQLPDWLRVKNVIEENGLRAGTTLNSINCLACIYRYINSSTNNTVIKQKQKQMSKAIRILKETVGVPRITHVSLQAICIIVREYIDTDITTMEKVIAKFNKIEIEKLLSTAITLKNNGTNKNVVSYLAFLLVQEYNNKCRKDADKLPIERINL